MLTRFPDGTSTDITSIQSFAAATSSTKPVIYFFGSDGNQKTFWYTCYDQNEQIQLLYFINQGLLNGSSYVDLLSTAPLPTSGNTLETDMYPNGSNSTPTSVAVPGGSFMLVSIGYASTTPPWPWTLNVQKRLVASFQKGFRVELQLHGTPATRAECKAPQYVNATTIQFTLPTFPAGTYDMIYSDSRGSVNKQSAFTYA